MAEPLRFFLVTDTHIFGQALGTSGAAFQKLDAYGSTCYKASGALFDAAAKTMLNTPEIDTVLLSGDITSNGEYLSNAEAAKHLEALQNAGKRVVAVTATHDYTSDDRFPGRVIESFAYEGENAVPARGTKRTELDGFYAKFGKQQALSIHEASGSYCIRLKDGYRLLCLNDDGNGVNCGYDRDCMNWIHENVQAAHAAGDFIFAMTHHPVVPPTPLYPMVSKRDMLLDYETVADTFAAWGLTLIFTGHTHIQCIRSRKTPSGRTFYDVGTAALVSYPVPIRKVEIQNGEVHIETLHPETFTMDGETYNTLEYTKTRFDSIIYGAIDGARHDIDRLAAILNGLSIGRAGIDAHKRLVRFAGFVADKITVGAVDRLLCLHSGVRDIRKTKVKDLFADGFRGFYAGERFVRENSAEYRFLRALTSRALGLAKKAGMKKAGEDDFQKTIFDILDSVLFPTPIDPNTATFNLDK